MPNSSRRKQSKPQHVLNEGEEGDKAGKNSDTSNNSTTGNQPTQEGQYGSKVTGHLSWENGNTGENSGFTVKAPVDDEEMDTSDSEGHESLDKNNIDESLPHDLSMKSRMVNKTDNLNDVGDRDEETDRLGLAPMYTPPSENLSDRHCVYCNEIKASSADLDQHLQEHTLDRPHHCQNCNKLFKARRSLQHHVYMEHGLEPADNSSIAQHDLLLRKRHHDETQSSRDGHRSYTPEPSELHNSMDSPTNLSVSPSTSEMASKRQRMSESYSNIMSDIGLDLKVSRSSDVSLKAISSDSCDSQDLMKACTICSKTFPKPSDLKRHMMCHTGEKPFRCEHCLKPFRAKSSMHYHLKATHGIDIELSPGLEERYLRMKARAQMNVASRGHYGDQPYPFKENLDVDDIEDDTKSTDSMYFQTSGSGLGPDFKEPHSQGHYSQTGNDNRGAMDLSMSDKHQHAEKNYRSSNNAEGEVVLTAEAPFRRSKISIQNETVVITRLDGFNVTNGENASLFKCYLCGRMFQSLSSMQCHLSLHFEKQIVSYECCFCNEVFQFKTQMRNHIQRKHNHQVSGRNRRKGGKTNDTNDIPDNVPDTDNPSHKTKTTLYRCRYCRKGFYSKISLNKHLKLHFWNRNCFCRICGKSFQHYTSLQLHISRFHWKAGRQGNKSLLQGKFNFFNTKRFNMESHDGVQRADNTEPLDLIKSKTYQNDRNTSLVNAVTVVMPRSPLAENGELSDTGASHHSSENNWSESPTDLTVTEYDETGAEIKAAPKRSLMSFRRENSPRSKSSRKSTPAHLPPQNQSTSDNSLPLNFIKSEMAHQDSNNNESSSTQESGGRLSPDPKPHIHESLLPGYALNATNHLLMAKALAAQQSLAQHLNPNSPSLIYPRNHLPPSLAAMTQMMSLPMSVQVPSSSAEARAGTSKSPSPASHSSSKSDTSPEDRDGKEPVRDSLVGYPRVQWGQHKGPPDWTFNMYCTPDTSHTDGRKVTSLSRTHSRLGIVHSPINRESMCKPTTLADGRIVYKCPFCSKEFVSFSDINRHMDFHEDIRPYKCQFCDYYARTNSQLKVHMMRHQGIREFCCKLCNYKGVTQSDLNRHMKSQIHMLKSRNACSYCGEGFVTPKNLEKHLDGNCIVKMQKLNGGLDIRLQESVA